MLDTVLLKSVLYASQGTRHGLLPEKNTLRCYYIQIILSPLSWPSCQGEHGACVWFPSKSDNGRLPSAWIADGMYIMETWEYLHLVG